MNREDKKQWVALFILLMFGGSTIAIAVSSVFPSEVQEKLIIDEPLTDSQEAQYFQKNMVVVRIYYDEPTDTIDILNNMVNTLNQKMFLERIYTTKYPDWYNSVKDSFSSTEMPMILIRGKTEIRLNGEQTEENLKSEICSVYFQDIDECSTFI